MLVEETVVVPATAMRLADLHDALGRFWAAVDQALAHPPDVTWRLQFATAVAEIGANIVRYAYPAHLEPGLMRLRLRAYGDRAEACFTDEGIAFTGSSDPGNRRAPDPLELPEGGFGLALARASLDQLDYSRTPEGTNCWRLVKWLSS